MTLQLYGHPDSGHACKVALALALADLDHQVTRVDIWAAPDTRPADFLAVSPLAEVPVLVIDGQPIFQSGAILMEIAQQFAVLGGDTSEGRRRGRELLMWEANRIGMCLPQLKEARRPGSAGLPPEVIGWLEARYTVDCVNFARLKGDAPFFHGDTPGIGDCAIWGYTQWLAEAGVAPTQPMADWLDNMRALEAMKTPDAFFAV
ncbi:glutathione S-transferase family protein [Tropicibacter naphthalenivorans]|uniref:Disulfide-bond oxidoreductase YfcG n=1 Tax=Tropicibacter naphthalenivorans TaxID=441103 RepID=A0A0P1GJZ6_9RHOB|nr:glutathione S-transferase family protein [Tropicibacter naphthalenivorans]CUH82164.1 Disulfide-bond oxidoreductase YfcG [Tropicibacter naphthalenivorans]SMD05042.1 glutathione S-transferase [Tropicibacter naphthalenivorans]